LIDLLGIVDQIDRVRLGGGKLAAAVYMAIAVEVEALKPSRPSMGSGVLQASVGASSTVRKLARPFVERPLYWVGRVHT